MAAKLGGSTPRSRRQAPPPSAPPRAAVAGDNAKGIAEAEEAQFLSYLSKIKGKEAEIDKAMSIVKGYREEKASLMALAKSAGFPAHLIKEVIDDGKVTGARKDLRASEALRSRLRRYAGLPVGDPSEADLFEAMPVEARDEVDWEGDGYAAGVRADEPKPPSKCPPRFTQAWMKGYHNGQSRNAWALQKAAEVPPPPPEAPVEPEEKSAADIRRDEKAEERRAKEALDAIAEAEPEIVAQVLADHGGEAQAAGYDVTQGSDMLFTALAPDGDTVGRGFTNPEAAWEAADAHLAANPVEATD